MMKSLFLSPGPRTPGAPCGFIILTPPPSPPWREPAAAPAVPCAGLPLGAFECSEVVVLAPLARPTRGGMDATGLLAPWLTPLLRPAFAALCKGRCEGAAGASFLGKSAAGLNEVGTASVDELGGSWCLPLLLTSAFALVSVVIALFCKTIGDDLNPCQTTILSANTHATWATGLTCCAFEPAAAASEVRAGRLGIFGTAAAGKLGIARLEGTAAFTPGLVKASPASSRLTLDLFSAAFFTPADAVSTTGATCFSQHVSRTQRTSAQTQEGHLTASARACGLG